MTDATQVKAAVLGLGTMGGPMAANMAAAGLEVGAWNRTPGRPGAETAAEAGAHLAATASEAVAGAAVVLTCVSDFAALDELFFADGLVEVLAPGATVVDTSTIGPKAAVALAAKLGDHGVGFVDAPVSGGDVGARNGTLTVMAGGNEADFAAVEPVLQAIGGAVHRCGPVGSGQAVKMCNQVLCAIHAQALSEAFTLADHMGLDRELVTEVCSTGAAGSWALANLGPDITAENFEPGFAIRHMLKDLRLAQSQTTDGVPDLPGLAAVTQRYEDAAERFGADRGTQALYLTYRDQ